MIDINNATARPPYVEFHRVAKPDPQRSVELGYRVTKDVDMAHVMQPGSKDKLEINAKDWLATIKKKSLEGAHDAFPEEWVSAFHRKYEAWSQGFEEPLNGTSVREWPSISPAQAQNLIAINVTTIEDVAAMTEDAMQRFGMGGRELREKAREWIKTREMASGVIKENEALKAQLDEQAKLIAALEEKISALASQPRPGRKPKLQEAA